MSEDLGYAIPYSLTVAREVGPVAAVLFGCLAQMTADERQSGAARDGWVSMTQDDILRDTGLSWPQQKTARRRLVKAGYLEERRGGLPARLYFRLRGGHR